MTKANSAAATLGVAAALATVGDGPIIPREPMVGRRKRIRSKADKKRARRNAMAKASRKANRR